MDRLPDSKCDFCSANNPRWCFPARTFTHIAHVQPVDKYITATMHDEWAACDACAKLIHNGEANALAERVYAAQDVKESLMAILFRNELLRTIIKFQDEFRKNRLQGPPVLIRDR